MRYRKNKMSVATVNDDLLNTYQELTGDTSSHADIVRRVIREQILFRELETEKDLEELKGIANRQMFDYPGDMVSYLLREEIKGKLKVCGNCPAREQNGYCPILGGFVNPWHSSCGTI